VRGEESIPFHAACAELAAKSEYRRKKMKKVNLERE
jgi:hypothetical protein